MKKLARLINSVPSLSFSCFAAQRSDIMYKNPCFDLKEYLEVDIFDQDEIISPSIEAMKFSQELFVPKIDHVIKKISSTIQPEAFPSHTLPEVVFIGQSNAGKSSILKAIFQNVPRLLVKTSKKPGHTKSAQFFQVGSKLCLVDMPGYGTLQPKWFADVVEPYLKHRKNLVRTFFLIDGKVGFQGWDDVALRMLEEFKIPYTMVMTKIDTAQHSLLLRNLLHLKKIKDSYASICCFPQIFLISSHTYEGLAYFLAFIAHITGNLNMDFKCSSR